MEPKKSPVSKEVALASQVFDSFCAATNLKSILGQHRHLCELLRLKPSAFPHFYPKLKSKLCSWRAKALWAKFDKRASHKCYNRGKACPNTKVLIIGAGPCGLRTAIEAQLLGAKVVVVEKRDRISRHNVLHLWPFVIHDLKALNAKKFFGKFCAGAIDHISIRQLQCILLKVALILGVEFHEGVGFEYLIPPPEDQSVEKIGWRAKVTPADHPVSQYEFDVLLGADGKRNTLEGFKRKEFRGKLAIAITANFINRHTEAEARVEEISGVAFIFNQKFFKDLYAETGIDLENIVYYKDETHYFVMTAKKHSLISNGVILNDYPDTIKLLSAENKDQDALMKYARDAAEFSTNYIMQNLEFAVDHYGQPDVAMFDFTSMFAAENASRVVEKHGYKLLQMLVGDSLLEPFWPTGSGCARGFLSSLDACWAVKSWGSGQANVLEVLAERESIYRILGQTTPENLQRDYAAYTLDPHTRYPNLNKQAVTPVQVKQLFDTDDPAGVEVPQAMAAQDLPKKRRRKDSASPENLVPSLDCSDSPMVSNCLQESVSTLRARLDNVLRNRNPPNSVPVAREADLLKLLPATCGKPTDCLNTLPSNTSNVSSDTSNVSSDTSNIPSDTSNVLADTSTVSSDNSNVSSDTFNVSSETSTVSAESRGSSRDLRISETPDDSAVTLPASCVTLVDSPSNLPDDNLKTLPATGGENPAAHSNALPAPKRVAPKEKRLELSTLSVPRSAPVNERPTDPSKTSPAPSKLCVNERPTDPSKTLTAPSKLFVNERRTDPSKTSPAPSELCVNERPTDPSNTLPAPSELCVNERPTDPSSTLPAPSELCVNERLTEHLSTSLSSGPVPIGTEHATQSNTLLALQRKPLRPCEASNALPVPAPRYRIVNRKEKDLDVFIRTPELSNPPKIYPRTRYIKTDAMLETNSIIHTAVKSDSTILPGGSTEELSVLKTVTNELPPDIPKLCLNFNHKPQNPKIFLQRGTESSSIRSEANLDTPYVSRPMNNKSPLIKKILKTSARFLTMIKNKKDSHVHPDTLLHWLKKQVALYDRDVVHVDNVTSSFKNGLALCAIIHRYRPDLLDFHLLKPEDAAKNNQLAFDTLERELGVPPVMTGLEMEQCDVPDKLAMLSYLSQVYDTFRGEIPHVKHARLEPEVKEEDPALSMHAQLRNLKPEHKASSMVSLLSRLTGHAPRVTPSRKRVSNDREGIEGVTATQRHTPADKKLDSSLRKPRKRRSQDKVGTQDREARIQEEIRKGGMTEENLSDRVKIIEDKLRGRGPATDKKPKDLNRAIGKIEKSDWNVKEIEKKIQENKMGRGKRQERGEKVPKWSRDQFDDRFQAIKMKHQRKSLDKEKEKDDKYADIDVSLKRLDRKIKEGSVLDMGQRGSNKVSALAEQLAYKTQEPEKPAILKSSSKAMLVLPSQGGSEACHFCNKRVYLMERLSAEGKFFHRGCFRCEYCSTTLRLGNYAFDRDGRHGSRFFCMQHFGQHIQPGVPKQRIRRKSEEIRMELGKENVPAKVPTPKSVEKVRSRSLLNPPSKSIVHDSMDKTDAVGELSEEEADAHSEMDEDEWTDVNFGASAAEGSSDSVSDISDSEEEPNEVFEEALDPPEMNADETRRLAETWTKRYSGGGHNGDAEKAAKEEDDDEDDSESYDDDGSDDGSEAGSDYDTDEEDSETATEGEEEIRARELRKLEVPHEAPPKGKRSSDTGSDTEIATDEYSSSESDSDEEENSATEISTDSEFEHDGTTPTQHEIPSILIDDSNITFRKRVHEEPKKVQVRTGHVIRPVNGTVGKPPAAQQRGVKLEFKNIRPENETMKSSSLTNLTSGINNINNNNTKLTTVVVPTPLINPRRGDYLLNRTMSTEGIASKLSLELKKKYLLGPSGLTGSVKKSGSASTLDSTFKSVVDVISEQQKLLKPAPELSPSMQAFLQGTSQVRPYSNSPVNPLSPLTPTIVEVSTHQPKVILPIQERKDLSSLELPYEHVCALRNKEDVVRPNEDSELVVDTHCSTAAAPASKVDSSLITAFANGVSSCKPIKERPAEEADCRPRSPVHETSIVVPDIPWKVKAEEEDEDMESDSLSSDESSESDEEGELVDRVPSPVVVKERTPPRVEVHDSSGEMIEGGTVEIQKEARQLPVVNVPAVKPNSIDLFNKKSELTTGTSERSSPSSPPSNKGDGSESLNNEATMALTETEWSDWAHDGDAGVSEDLDDMEYNINPKFVTQRRHKKPKKGHGTPARMARCEDFNDFDDFPQHVCGKKDELELEVKQEGVPLADTPQFLSSSIDNIEFMDTGEEDDSGTDDFLAATNKTLLQNSGYVQFVNTDDEDMETPIVETPKLPHLSPLLNVILLTECGETSDTPDPHSLELFNKNLGVVNSGDDDESYLQPGGATTDDTTTSDLITVKDSPLELCDTSFGDSFYTPGERDDASNKPSALEGGSENAAYEEYVRRIQGRISPFSNVRDSIDIRKSRKPPQKIHSQDCISEEVVVPAAVRTPLPPATRGISQKLEELSRDRSKQKDLVHEMVMGKISGRRSQERKAKRSITRGSMSPSVPPPCNHSDSTRSATHLDSSLPMEIATKQLPIIKSYAEQPKSLPTPTVDNIERHHSFRGDITTPTLNETEEFFTPMTSFKKAPGDTVLQHRPLSVHSSFRGQRPAKLVGKPAMLPVTPLTNPEAFSCPDIAHALLKSPDDPLRTPVAPPRVRTDDDKRTVDREQARLRARLKSDEELGLSPEDYIKSLKEKVHNRPGARLREPIQPLRTLDIGSNIYPKNTTTNPLYVDWDATTKPASGYDEGATCRHMQRVADEPTSPVSAPACLTPTNARERKKSKDPERRKSGIIQAVSDFFHKKKEDSRSPSPTRTPQKEAKEKFSRFKFAAKARDRNKQEKLSSAKLKPSGINARSKSLENNVDHQPYLMSLDATPPPVPPPPVNYLGNGAVPRKSEDSTSEPEDESHVTAPSTPSHGGGSSAEANGSSKRHSKMNQRMSRQIQLKRHRMAQEIQRQLEELDVKQRELERRGVCVEKALRGEAAATEVAAAGGGEEELLREWFDLMREQSELKRYERELLLRAEELELEDRHTRLQQELRDKMSKDDASKSSEDVVKEGQILAEMLDIVERKDSLVNLLEEDRLRHQKEGRDLEAQMLAKGLRVTPVSQESHV